MGNRLNIEITDGEYVLANCGYLGMAYTDSSLDLAESIIKSYNDFFSGSENDLYVVVSLFELSGAGITGVERKRIIDDQTGQFEGLDFRAATGASYGFIAVTETGIRENRRLENYRIVLNLEEQTMDFHVHYYTYMEEYIEFVDIVPGCVPWDELPQLEADPDIFDGVYFDHIYMLRKIIEQFPCGFRISNGDVIEWV